MPNYFVINRKHHGRLTFEGWLNEQHIPVKVDLYEQISTAVKTAKTTYLALLEEGIAECSRLNYVKPASKLTNLKAELDSMSKVSVYLLILRDISSRLMNDIVIRNGGYDGVGPRLH